MLVEHLSIRNKQIHIEDQSVDLSEYGLYLLQGDNGSGKTSLIKKIIFDEEEVEFCDEAQKEAYQKDRYNLISYLPQDIISYACKVREYMSKCRADISNEEMADCLKRLHGEEIGLDMEFHSLSGGEKVKVALASTVLKDTPYLFLDEPTNNLDNETVQEISDFLIEYGKNHTVVVVSHDVRLNLKNCKRISIENNQIIEQQSAPGQKNIKKCSNIKLNTWRLLRKVVGNRVRIFSFCATVMLFVSAVILNIRNMEMRLSTDHTASTRDVIVTYKADLVYGDLNQVYGKAKGFQIAEKDYYTMITYDDIPQIMSLEGVERAILMDTAYQTAVLQATLEGTLLEELTLISQPNVITEEFYYLGGYGEADALLLDGTYPKDEANEVAVSKPVLKKFFSFTDEMADRALGEVISIHGEAYTIVGIMDLDACLLSYESGQDYGYYEYDANTYPAYADQTKSYLEETGYYLSAETDNLYLFTDQNYEEAVLDYLMQTYPADNYVSNTYSKIWVRAYNAPVICMFVIINGILFLIISGLLFSLNKQMIGLQMNKLMDYENFYLKKGSIRKLFAGSYAAEGVLLGGILGGITVIVPQYAYVLYPILLMDVLLIYVPLVIYTVKISLKAGQYR